MKRTNTLQLGYYEQGDFTSAVPEIQRWLTVDAQLRSLFTIIGNGVLTGWNLAIGDGLSIVVSTGSGHVNFVAVESTQNTTITNLVPSTRNYVYASLSSDSYWTKNVSFGAYATQSIDSDDILYIGYADTDETTVTAININGRSTLGFSTLVQNLISTHKHIGGTGNPSPIDLSSEVQGILNQENMPDMDASLIQTGTIDTERLPKIDHNTKVNNAGTLTHNQLDSFVDILSIDDKKLMGEVSIVNLLQLILALKHVYPEIDEYLVNEIAFIPGISPDEYVDLINTTATVDLKTHSEGGTHTITGQSVTGLNLYNHVWDSEDDYTGSTTSDILIDGNSVTLNTTTKTLILDQFNDVSQWVTETSDLSSITSQMTQIDGAGQVTLNETEVDVVLTIKKEFNAQDWSDYKYLTFYIKTENIEHGDIYFYFRDSTYGIQNSYVLVLPRNTPTVNVDTLEDGWQEVTIDITNYNRTSIDLMAFTTSTQDGWDTSKSLDFNIDTIILKSGNIYEDNGYVRVIFGSDFYYRFWKVRWDAIVPTDTGIVLKSRCRMANTQAGLPSATWTDYTTVSGTIIPIPSDTLYKYIEIEMYFEASDTLIRAPFMTKLYLDFYVNDTDSYFTFDTQAEWRTGNYYNIDDESTVGSIKVSNITDIGTYYYGSDNIVGQIDSDFNELYSSSGTNLPRSTYQAQNDLSPSLGLITGVFRGNNGHIWVSDIDNDRVLELDKYGYLVKGFYGSFLSAPVDLYGIEENGPGSNTDITSITQVASSSPENIDVLHSIYNPNTGILYIIFDYNLENIYDSATNLDLNKIYIKIGTQKIYLNDSTIELLGIDEDKYESWNAIYKTSNTYSNYISQFMFTSHVLKITVTGAERTLLDYMVNQTLPTIIISSPYEQKRITTSNIDLEFSLLNFTLGTGIGENSIRLRFDSGAWQTIYTDKHELSPLLPGDHTVDVQLVDDTSTPLTNIGAQASVSFVINPNTYSLPYLAIKSPKQNQVFSSHPIVVEFTCENFPIVSSGQHLRYILDSEPAVDHNSVGPITIEDVDPGVHTIRIYTVNSSGEQISYSYGDVTSTFIVGYNPNANVKLYVDYGAIYDVNKLAPASVSRTYIDIANIYFENIYSPIDVQVIPHDESGIGDGLPTVLIAKLRSPSWINSLGSALKAEELVKRLAISSTGTTDTSTLNTSFSALTDLDLIYENKYLDGHSVVQLDENGDTVFSNNAARFSDTKANAKDTLGSAEKLGSNELLVGDSINKRAIITYTNPSTKSTLIEWQYDSDRNVVDFHILPQEQKTIEIYDDSISEQTIFIRQGTSVTWVNNSSQPISIYSGTTTYAIFNLDPDLNLYGDVFYSPVLAIGDSYTYNFDTIGDFDWFVYPDILPGEINVTSQRISSRDKFYILESDGEESPFSSRLIKVDTWGNISWSFGESMISKPRDIRVMLNGNILLST